MKIFMKRKDVPDILLSAFPDYKGYNFSVKQTTIVNISGTYWIGGSRNEFRAVSLDDGRISSADERVKNPFALKGEHSFTIEIPSRAVIVEHSIFCGKDMGLTFHVRPEDTQNMLPAAIELSEDEKRILKATRQYKSSYNGQSRREMAGIPKNIWDSGQESLKVKGLLNKNGALSTAGKTEASRLIGY